jgi:hypothetical protein
MGKLESLNRCNDAVHTMLMKVDAIHIHHDNGVKCAWANYLDDVREMIGELGVLHNEARAALTPDVAALLVHARHEVMRDFTMPRWLDAQYPTAHEAACAFVHAFLETDCIGLDPSIRLRTFAPLWAIREFVVGIAAEAAAAREYVAGGPTTDHWLTHTEATQLYYDMRLLLAKDHANFAIELEAAKSTISRARAIRAEGKGKGRRFDPASVRAFIADEQRKWNARIDADLEAKRKQKGLRQPM